MNISSQAFSKKQNKTKKQNRCHGEFFCFCFWGFLVPFSAFSSANLSSRAVLVSQLSRVTRASFFLGNSWLSSLSLSMALCTRPGYLLQMNCECLYATRCTFLFLIYKCLVEQVPLSAASFLSSAAPCGGARSPARGARVLPSWAWASGPLGLDGILALAVDVSLKPGQGRGPGQRDRGRRRGQALQQALLLPPPEAPCRGRPQSDTSRRGSGPSSGAFSRPRAAWFEPGLVCRGRDAKKSFLAPGSAGLFLLKWTLKSSSELPLAGPVLEAQGCAALQSCRGCSSPPAPSPALAHDCLGANPPLRRAVSGPPWGSPRPASQKHFADRALAVTIQALLPAGPREGAASSSPPPPGQRASEPRFSAAVLSPRRLCGAPWPSRAPGAGGSRGGRLAAPRGRAGSW